MLYMNKNDVSIIIVNFNTKTLLDHCLESIFLQTKGVKFEVIVIDNASIDGSEELVRQKYPEVFWVNSGANLGFGRANNIGAEVACGKYLFLLNSDTILLNDAVSILYHYMESNMQKNKLGALGSYLLDRKGNKNVSYLDFPTPKSEFGYLWSKLCPKQVDDTQSFIDIDSICGADLFISRELFHTVGGFDPQIFMYYEETDLQYRIAKMGLKRRIITGPRIIHLEGGSFKSKGLSLKRFQMSQTSYNYYLRKHYRGFKYLFFKVSLIIVRTTLFITTDWSFKEKCKAYWLVLKG